MLTREEYRERVKFTDDFFFSRVMQDEGLCLRLAQVLTGVKIQSVKLHQSQRQLKRQRHTHGIRLDAYLEDEDRVVVIEMQTASQRWLFKRIRLYQGMLDTAMLPAGKSYMSLKDTYIVFLCTFDPVGLSLPVYTVRQTFKEAHEAKYDDGTCKILYNATRWQECQDSEVRAVLEYMQTGVAASDLVRDIDGAIEAERKMQAMRSEYMTLDMKLCEVRDETWGQAWGEAWGEASHQKAVDTARNLLSMGLDAGQIAQATGLSKEDVESLV